MIEMLYNGIKLYHGSYCEVKHPELGKCRKYKDFGRGFYLTTDLDQATRFAKLSLRKAVENNTVPGNQLIAYVSCFQYIEDDTCKINIFDDADAEWLHCVVGHRKQHSFPSVVSEMDRYDVIGGKIANDATNATILAYMSGTFGEIGSEQADRICISLLLPEKLKDQYCFKTVNAINHLKYLETLKI